ncbi:hypothetical protein FVEG_06103 [Fusarium verticillioides 7600]|uniref:Uncharacterized protein n=1 Tax=Gibberella moniliformis (strain M3125 / FGSC 7600) TaxID=334819 RepID=W7M0W1_GIBM7|nr:hypothetical protein FVEG_06103 [Fusarium verticillioides 7600]EWG45223.1 hypothetical protein FVEG_06103 [Fusarium verticillioides 7600]
MMTQVWENKEAQPCGKPNARCRMRIVHPYAWGPRPRPSYQSGKRDRRAQSPGTYRGKATRSPPRYRVNCLGCMIYGVQSRSALL